MKPCSTFEEALALQAAGVLGREEFSTLEIHLAGCPGCREALLRLEQLAKAAAPEQLPLPAVPPGFHQRLVDRVCADASRQTFGVGEALKQWLRGPRLAFAALLIAALMTWTIFQMSSHKVSLVRPVEPSTNSPSTPTLKKDRAESAPDFMSYRLALSQSLEHLDALLVLDEQRSAGGNALMTAFAAGKQGF